MKKWITIAGYIILILSCILWALILVIPWLGFSKGKIAGLLTLLIVAGEITFYISVILLGKSIIVRIKKHLMFWKKKTG
jgi:hypothetical protein